MILAGLVERLTNWRNRGMFTKVNFVRYFLTTSIVIFVLILLVSLFYFNIPMENKDLVNILLGAVIGWASNIVSFYFGSSDKSNRE